MYRTEISGVECSFFLKLSSHKTTKKLDMKVKEERVINTLPHLTWW